MSSHNIGISKNITKRKSVTFIPKDHLEINNSNINVNPKTKSKRKSMISNSTITSPSNKSSSSGKTKKTKIKLTTTTLKVEKVPGKTTGRRGSYCDLFKLKQSYVSNDFSLTQKPESGYSILYKDGVRVFEDVEKGNVNNSIKSSFILSNNRSKNSLSPNRKNRRRGSVEASLYRKNGLLTSEKREIDDYLKSMDNKINRRKSVEYRGTSEFYKNLLGTSSSSSSSSSSNNSSNLSRKNSSYQSLKGSFKVEKIDENEIKKKIDKKKQELKSSFKKSFNSIKGNEKRKSIKKKK